MTNEAGVRTMIENWARAVSAGDRSAILAHYPRDLRDRPTLDFPETVRGIEAYDKTWRFFFDNPCGPIRGVPRDIEVTAGDDVAFATCLVHCDGTSAGPLDFRLTAGLRDPAPD